MNDKVCSNCLFLELDPKENPCAVCQGNTPRESLNYKETPNPYKPKTALCISDGVMCEYTRCLESKEPCLSCLNNSGNHYKPVVSDPVNHPDHYCQEGSVECIDEMIAVFGIDAVRTFCLLNVWKYRKRAIFKNGKEDMEKSDWYMKKYIELEDE